MKTNKELIIERALEIGFTPAQMNALEIELQEVEKLEGNYILGVWDRDTLVDYDGWFIPVADMKCWKVTPQGHNYWLGVALHLGDGTPLPQAHSLHISNFEPWEETEGALTPKGVDELNYLQFFYSECDFGPAHEDIVETINAKYAALRGKEIPEGY